MIQANQYGTLSCDVCGDGQPGGWICLGTAERNLEAAAQRAWMLLPSPVLVVSDNIWDKSFVGEVQHACRWCRAELIVNLLGVEVEGSC